MRSQPYPHSFCFYALVLLVLCAFSGNALAEEPAPAYHFELIIFKHKKASVKDLENVIDPDLQHRLKQTALTLYDTEPDDEITLVTNPQRFKLTEELERITSSDLYEVLSYVAWQQPPEPRSRARYINIIENTSQGLLIGIAWASYERYFQLRLDMAYNNAPQQKLTGLNRPQSDSDIIPIHMKKIMSVNTLYYIDHPLIGVLAYVYPLEEGSEEALLAPRGIPMADAQVSTATESQTTSEDEVTTDSEVLLEDDSEILLEDGIGISDP